VVASGTDDAEDSDGSDSSVPTTTTVSCVVKPRTGILDTDDPSSSTAPSTQLEQITSNASETAPSDPELSKVNGGRRYAVTSRLSSFDGKLLEAADEAIRSARGIPPPRQVMRRPSVVEGRIMQMLSGEEWLKKSTSRLAVELPDLFDMLEDEAVARMRALIDGGCIFRQDGTAADLRSIVFDGLTKKERQRILTRIHAACTPPSPERAGFIVLSDVDDTLLPGHDMLQMAGSDRSWHLDGRLYPGASRMHVELRGDLRSDHGKDYSVLLTARPTFMVKPLLNRYLRRISGLDPPRMAILPGEGSSMNVAMNALLVLTGNYSSLGKTKVMRMLEYASLFPEYAGRFVFIGDDGQADLEAAQEMLSLDTRDLQNSRSRSGTRPRLSSEAAPTALMAFVAIHATRGTSFNVPEWRRLRLVRETRAKFPALAKQSSMARDGPVGIQRHRFFYFTDYSNLAEQLAASGWIQRSQCQAILRAADRDSMPDLGTYVAACDLRGLRQGIANWSESMAEGDEVEQDLFRHAGEVLPDLVRAHVRLAVPPPGTTGIILKVIGIRLGNFRWPGPEQPVPTIAFQDIGVFPAPRSSLEQWVADLHGNLRLPWPCEALCRGGSRAVIDIRGPPGAYGRCFIMLDDMARATHDRGTIEVALLSLSEHPDVTEPVGEMTLIVNWVQAKNGSSIT